MATHPLAGKPAPHSLLPNIPRLVTAYFTEHPVAGEDAHRVEFGTSGHRGVATAHSFNEDHLLAMTQAVCDVRRAAGIAGPLFLGMDTHALSEPAFVTALEVLAANGVQTFVQADRGYTPTPVISHAILTHNQDRGGDRPRADGIIITPSHNPPDNGGFKYNPPHGGPADTDVTGAIERRANALLAEGLRGVARIPFALAWASDDTHRHDFVRAYVDDLAQVVDMDLARSGRLKIGVDPMGGSGIGFWEPIATRYGLELDLVNPVVDPTFGFMPLDHDGKIRMDCSSPYAMARLIELKDRYDVAFGNDPDFDRHGIVTRDGLMNPNHYLATAIHYLFQHRPRWRADAAVGKTLVSSSMIDKVAAALGRPLAEVPVGFKWFVPGLLDGSFGFGGEESAGASFLRRDGSVWTTDKDGFVMDLLAIEMTAATGKTPSELYAELTARFGSPVYARIDAPATDDEKARLKQLAADNVSASTLAGDPIRQKLTRAPANGAAIGGLKVVTDHGWFAARPSGTEAIYKIYAESFRGAEHLAQIQEEARTIVAAALAT